jgi:predicted alpha/beta-fold hydrolase
LTDAGVRARWRDQDTIPFAPSLWLPGGHAQTIVPALLPRPEVSYRRERVAAPDGDFWDFDWLVPAADTAADAPLVVLFHGLEGSSASHYALALMTRLATLKWRGVVPHFRGCGGEPNRMPRAYHSGDYAEVGAMLAAVRARVDPATCMFAFGVSLGGSALLNWVGREGAEAASMVTAAAAASVPLDLMASGIAIDQGINRLIYVQSFLRTLKPKVMAMERRFPGLVDVRRAARVKTMWEFDDTVTAPLHGFAGADDYWTRGSSKPWLREVALPTLVLNAQNDPFVPATSLPATVDVSPSVVLLQPAHGGHAGFPTPSVPGRNQWLAQRVTSFFATGA